jgi:hypothetical protein
VSLRYGDFPGSVTRVRNQARNLFRPKHAKPAEAAGCISVMSPGKIVCGGLSFPNIIEFRKPNFLATGKVCPRNRFRPGRAHPKEASCSSLCRITPDLVRGKLFVLAVKKSLDRLRHIVSTATLRPASGPLRAPTTRNIGKVDNIRAL